MLVTAGCGARSDESAASSGRGGGSTPTNPPPPSTQVTVTPNQATVYQGATVQFQAQVKGQSNQAVTWSVEYNIGTIDGAGLYTAPRDGYGGPFHVIATSQARTNVTGSAVVNVVPIQVTVFPATVALFPGGTQTFTSAVLGLSNTDTSWTVQEANGGIVTNTGFYTAPTVLGFYHVVATSVGDATHSSSATVTVTTSSASFKPTGSMQHGRGFHTSNLLANGKVLLAGGTIRADPICLGGISSAELYDPATGSFTLTGSMTALRYAHTATLMANGDVLMAGGFGNGYDCEDLGEPSLSTAEIYHSSSGVFISVSHSMSRGRGGHTATLLLNGTVLLAGGGDQGGGSLPFYGTGSSTAELYDPATGIFISTGSMTRARLAHSATLLANGTVLIAGGVATSLSSPTATAEIYNPASGVFAPTGSMTSPRMGHTATRLPDGRVLIAGGYSTGIVNGEFGVSETAEIYDPATGTFTATGDMGARRSRHTATLLPGGTVLVAGGGDSTAEVYDSSKGSFSTTGGMEEERSGHSATLLKNGMVLVSGGGTWSPLLTAELYK
jgi:hypothetical protein